MTKGNIGKREKSKIEGEGRRDKDINLDLRSGVLVETANRMESKSV